MFELYDFTFSHYSEKARWALDFKGIPYTPRHLLPGFHLRTTRKLAPRSSVPILKTDDAVIQGSAEIINFLDETFPSRSLTPPDPQDASAAIEWEKYLDVEIGVTLRLWFYHYALPDRGRALRFLCQDASWLDQRRKIRGRSALAFNGVRASPATPAATLLSMGAAAISGTSNSAASRTAARGK